MPGWTRSARRTLNELIGEAKSSGVTVVIASHEAGFVDALATRAVTVTGGRITGDRLLGVAPSTPATLTTDVAAGTVPSPRPAADPAGRPDPEVAHVA